MVQQSRCPNDKNAAYYLGILYSKGKGISQDEKLANEWFNKYAKQDGTTQFSVIGRLFAEGYDVPQDYKKALAWYMQGDQQGENEAKYNIAELYANGQGVTKGNQQAAQWYSKWLKMAKWLIR